MIPLLPFYAEKLGASPTEVGWLVGVYAACQLVSGPLLGRFSDVTGRKPLLVMSQGGTAIGFLITALAPSLFVLFLGRAVAGATAGNLSLAQAYISDVTRPEERAKAFGIIGIAFSLGFLVGPAISGFLAKFDYRHPVFAAAALSAANMINTWLVLPSVAPGGGQAGAGGSPRPSVFDWRTWAEYFHRPVLAGRLWQFLMYALGFSMFVAGLPLFLERRLTWAGMPFGPEQVGYTWAFAGLIGVFLQGPALGRLVARFGEQLLNRVGLAGCVLGFVILAFCHTIPTLVLSILVVSIGGLARPALTSLITHAAAREEQGAVLGLTQSLQSVAMIAAPPLGGWMIDYGILTGWGLAAAAVTLVGFLLAAGSSQPAATQASQHSAEVRS